MPSLREQMDTTVSEPYPHRSATDEDVQRLLGSRKVLIGFPVQSTPSADDDDVSFISPSVPGRTVRLTSVPPPEEDRPASS
jgi:hypothetical protein